MKWLFPIILLGSITYTMTFLGYFIGGHSFGEFIASQKWTIHFYLSSEVKPVFGTVFTTLLGGLIKGWSEGNTSWQRVSEWTIFWPLYTVSFLFMIYQIVKSHKLHSKEGYLSILITGFMISYIVIPFFSRYLLLILPFMILLFVIAIDRLELPHTIMRILLILLIIQSIAYLFPTPRDTVYDVQKKWEASIYQDLYSHFDTSSQQGLKRQTFWEKMLTFERELKLTGKTVTINIPYTFPWENKKEAPYKITYQTPLGEVIQQGKIHFIRQDNVWKILWKPTLALSSWDYKAHIISEIHEGTYGKMKSKNGDEISSGAIRPYFMVTPSRIDDDTRVLNQLFQLTAIDKKIIEQRYKANTPREWQASIGFLHPTWPDTYLLTFQLDPGISVNRKMTRAYNNNLVTKTNFPNLQNLEMTYKDIINPKSGGKIILITSSGKRIIIVSRDTKNGIDVILP
jgi:hypothetical protein